MGFTETGERNWLVMSFQDRKDFLDKLAIAINRKPDWWNGRTTQSIARIFRFDDLPGDLRGRVIMAMTEDGFSIEEQARTQTVIDNIANR